MKREGTFYVSPSLSGWKARILNKVMGFLRRKGMIEDYIIKCAEERFNPHLNLVVDTREVASLVCKAIDDAQFYSGSKVECIIMGYDVFSRLARGDVGNQEYINFVVEVEHSERRDFPFEQTRHYFANVKVKVIPWFEGILVVPADR